MNLQAKKCIIEADSKSASANGNSAAIVIKRKM